MKNIPLLLAVLGGTLACVVAIAFFFTKMATAPVDIKRVLGDQRYATGSGQPKVTVVEFSDFQCPACKASQPVVDKIRKSHADTVRFVYRQFPLINIHRNAEMAANAAEVMGSVGKFWSYHDLLFEKQEEWGPKTPDEAKKLFVQYGVGLGVPGELIQQALEKGTFQQKVSQDVADANALGVSATPTFYINDQQVAIEDLESTLANLLK